ncbi:TniQ family protein [Scytonema sp. UIC 10036]|uniref:TniQ family protein n=1 Tax=Scytonema sp. UIC 10036 TaxID=2304196 RepID=UPI00140FD949|nr:TniQ family protein [Scytonema sp. UIC 10036]
MINSHQTLLLTPTPYPSESLAGYLLRLTEKNYYESPNWILQLAGLKAQKGIYIYEKPREPSCLSQLIRVEDKQLFFMASLPYETVYESNIRHYTIYKHGRKLCPQCLKESAYCQMIWDCQIVKACPKHQCLLIQKCPACQKDIKWSRPGVTQCKCGFDFRTTLPSLADSYQVNQSLYLYKLNSDARLLSKSNYQ